MNDEVVKSEEEIDDDVNGILYLMEIQKLRSQLEDAHARLSVVEHSASWRFAGRAEAWLSSRGPAALLLRRICLATWWTATGQIGPRMRAFRENRRRLSTLEARGTVTGSELFHPPYAPKVSVLVPFARSEALPVHSDSLAELPFDWEIIFLEARANRWRHDERVRYVEPVSGQAFFASIDKMSRYAFGQYIVLCGVFNFERINEGIRQLREGGDKLVVLSPGRGRLDGTIDGDARAWRDGTIVVMEARYWEVCRDRFGDRLAVSSE